MAFVSDSVSVNSNKQNQRGRLFGTVLSVLSFISIYLLILNSGPLYWPGWFLLKFSPSVSLEDIENRLADSETDGALSAQRAAVSYMDIPSMSQISIDSLDSALIPGDPRRDPYLNSVHRLFVSGPSHLVYLPADRALLRYYQILNGEDAQLMDLRSASLVYALLFLVVSAAAGWLAGTRGARLAAALPCAAFAALYPSFGIVLPLLLAGFFSPVYAHRRCKRLFPLFFCGYLLSAAVLFLSIRVQEFAALGAALTVSELIMLLCLRKSENAKYSKQSEHRLFAPVSLSSSQDAGQKAARQPRSRRPLAAALILLSVFIPRPQSAEHSPLPGARKSATVFEDLPAMRLLADEYTEGSLPDVSQLVSSVVYQQGFMFGARYEVPLPGSQLQFPRYTESAVSLQPEDFTVTEYSSAYLFKLTDAALAYGPGRLFASLGGPAPVTFFSRPPQTVHSNPVRRTLLGTAFIFLLFCALMPHSPGRNSIRSIFFNKRKKARAA